MTMIGETSSGKKEPQKKWELIQMSRTIIYKCILIDVYYIPTIPSKHIDPMVFYCWSSV